MPLDQGLPAWAPALWHLVCIVLSWGEKVVSCIVGCLQPPRSLLFLVMTTEDVSTGTCPWEIALLWKVSWRASGPEQTSSVNSDRCLRERILLGDSKAGKEWDFQEA